MSPWLVAALIGLGWLAGGSLVAVAFGFLVRAGAGEDRRPPADEHRLDHADDVRADEQGSYYGDLDDAARALLCSPAPDDPRFMRYIVSELRDVAVQIAGRKVAA